MTKPNSLYKLALRDSPRATKEMYFRVVSGDNKVGRTITMAVEISEWENGEMANKKVYSIKMARHIWNDQIRRGYVPCEPEEFITKNKDGENYALSA